MNTEQYKEFLLNSIPSARLASGGREIMCRCFECEDSNDPRSAHFYISLPKDENDLSLYHCFKCNCAGIVTYKKLIEWNLYDEQIAIYLTNHNAKCLANPSNSKYKDRIIYNVNNPICNLSEQNEIKRSYINNRLGVNLSYLDLSNLKIVLNLFDLLYANGFNELTRKEFIATQLNYNFIGFLSIDNAFLNMRRIVDEGLVHQSIDKRYVNYKLFNKFDTSERFYTVPTMIDLLSPEPIKIHIAEGPFDILSIYLNLRNKEPGIYSSIAGSNYLGLIMYFINTYKLPYVEIHLYPDNDKSGSKEKMQKIANIIKIFGFKLFIHRNLYPGEKDFGVNKDRIKEGIIELL